ncbi:MAG: phosphoribosyltransferase family protein, partial [Candidatus Ratteibacteria bacterium]|nr:phosphoribosyltransferase family protein [Candidatus Ratteibacteria bacterium]
MDHFTDREQAGDILAEKLAVLKPRFTNPIVLGIPRGGVSVGYRISKELDIPLDIIVLRKLPVPYNPETGFGAVTLDKTVIFNEELMMRMNLSQKEINEIIDDV